MIETTLCAADACNSAALKGAYCPTHRKEKALAWRDIGTKGETDRREYKIGTLERVIEIERTINEVAALNRNIVRYNVAFDQCVEHYKGLRFSSWMNLTQNLETTGGSTRSTRIVRASKSDYRSEFEITAKRLSSRMQRVLLLVLDGRFDEARVDRVPGLRQKLHVLKQQLGRLLVQREVWPLHTYFRPVYVDVFAG